MKACDSHKVNVKFKFNFNSEHSISEHGNTCGKVELVSFNILQCFQCFFHHVWTLFFSQVEKYWMIIYFISVSLLRCQCFKEIIRN